MDYRVALDIYKGPLDLLLYLIQESEVDIADIPIAKITDQYLRHLEVIKELDPNLAGEFLVMASTLMEIKSRMLLPRPEKVEGEVDEGDPRIELIRQLMEYKKFKEAAALLADRREEHLDRFGRGSKQTFGEDADAEAVDLSEVSIWDILSAFDRIMRETMRMQPTTIVNRDVPLRQHIETILRMLRVQGMVTFLSVFEACEDRLEAIGSLLALLEMTRWRVITLEQTASHGTILVKLAHEENVEKLMNALSAHPDMTAAPMEMVAAETAPPGPAPTPSAEPAPKPEETALAAEGEPEPEAEPEGEPDDSDKLSRYEPDEEDVDEDLDRIRKIEIHDVDLSLGEAEEKEEDQTDAKPSDADRATEADAHQPAVAEGAGQGEGQVEGGVLAEGEAPEPVVSDASEPTPSETPAEHAPADDAPPDEDAPSAETAEPPKTGTVPDGEEENGGTVPASRPEPSSGP